MIKIATTQFNISDQIEKNKDTIVKLTNIAKKEGAHIVHFPECSLTGYLPSDEFTKKDYNWNEIHSSIRELKELSKKNKIYMAIGTPMYNNKELPYNSIILIDPNNEKIEQYNKRFLWADEYKYFSYGDKNLIYEINNIKIGFLICYEMNFFELFREYKRNNVICIFVSVFSCLKKKINDFYKISKTIPIEYYSKYNQFWISISNHCNGISSWICDPEGTKKILPKNQEYIEYTEIGPNKSNKTKFDLDRDLLLLGNKNNKNI